jgi:hypothetical protein
LIAPGKDSNILSGPLAGINSLNAGNRSHIHQLISNLSTQLGVSAESPVAYERYIEPILKIESENSENDSIKQEANDPDQLQGATHKNLGEFRMVDHHGTNWDWTHETNKFRRLRLRYGSIFLRRQDSAGNYQGLWIHAL